MALRYQIHKLIGILLNVIPINNNNVLSQESFIGQSRSTILKPYLYQFSRLISKHLSVASVFPSGMREHPPAIPLYIIRTVNTMYPTCHLR